MAAKEVFSDTTDTKEMASTKDNTEKGLTSLTDTAKSNQQQVSSITETTPLSRPIESPPIQTTGGPTILSATQAVLRVEPQYPRNARRKGQQGEVTLLLSIFADGTVHHVEITRSSGYASLDDSASVAASNWRFPAANQDLRQGHISFTFQLLDGTVQR
jgi:TonB family protein